MSQSSDGRLSSLLFVKVSRHVDCFSLSMSSTQKFKIMFAIDPQVPELRPSNFELAWVRKRARDSNAEVEVVHVAFGTEVAQISQNEFSNFVTHLHLGEKAVATIIHDKSNSRRKAVSSLIEYLQRQSTDLLIVSSHGRSGPSRMVLGSFAESLLTTSPVPILFLAEGLGKPKRLNKILFPTDFSPFSKKTLNLLLDQIEGFTGEIILFHAIALPVAILETGIMGGPIYVPENYWEDQQNWVSQESEALMKQVSGRGYQCRIVTEPNQSSPSASIRKLALAENVSLIAMASVKVDVSSTILGSVARGIFRERKWPVWVCGPEVHVEKQKSEYLK